MSTKYIFVAGGVMSGIGKGIATASIGRILKSKGFKVTAIKIDPYLNVDAGTMSPFEHGETFVLNDGTETGDAGAQQKPAGLNGQMKGRLDTMRIFAVWRCEIVKPRHHTAPSGAKSCAAPAPFVVSATG